MASNKSTNNNSKEWFTFSLTPDLQKQLNDYLLAVANKRGKPPRRGLKSKIGRAALKKWLDENEENLDIF